MTTKKADQLAVGDVIIDTVRNRRPFTVRSRGSNASYPVIVWDFDRPLAFQGYEDVELVGPESGEPVSQCGGPRA